MKPVIFTDLDGTLLDDGYSFEAALPVIRRIKDESIPLVPVTSKTRAEVERVRELLGVGGPFITENGGGVFIPDGAFPFPVRGEDAGGMKLIRLGTSYEVLKSALAEIRKETGFRITGFADLTPEEITERTGLPLADAVLSKEREFDEPFFLESGSVEEVGLLAESVGLTLTRGKILHLTGDNDKGRAVETLKTLYRALYGKAIFIGLGDRGNDVPLLKNVDYPVLVRGEEGGYEPVEGVPKLIKADGAGPVGWAKAVTGILDTIKASGSYTC
ncbi:mannosyl-3-phosphoglycerate phosphatase [uncultured bacterium]|nr:mannosyl-3-phosphoglycerate phosphatase [uncultured bacterium]